MSIATGLGRKPGGCCYSAEMRRPAIRSTAHDPILSYPILNCANTQEIYFPGTGSKNIIAPSPVKQLWKYSQMNANTTSMWRWYHHPRCQQFVLKSTVRNYDVVMGRCRWSCHHKQTNKQTNKQKITPEYPTPEYYAEYCALDMYWPATSSWWLLIPWQEIGAKPTATTMLITLQWRHNGRDSVSNHQPHDCFLKHLFRHRSKKTSKLRVTGLCAENSTGAGELPA